MQHTDYTPRQDMGAVCDYDMYDRIWQRVSPDLNPYPHVRGEESCLPAVWAVTLVSRWRF